MIDIEENKELFKDVEFHSRKKIIKDLILTSNLSNAELGELILKNAVDLGLIQYNPSKKLHGTSLKSMGMGDTPGNKIQLWIVLTAHYILNHLEYSYSAAYRVTSFAFCIYKLKYTKNFENPILLEFFENKISSFDLEQQKNIIDSVDLTKAIFSN